MSIADRGRWTWATMMLLALPAPAQECLDMLNTKLVNTAASCSSIESIERAFGGQVMLWNESHYLFENIGNEIKVWNIDTRSAPVLIGRSSFNVANAGDSDYDMLNFSVCDDCRWGVANFKGGTVLFDLGIEAQPEFTAFTFDSDANLVPGAFTFAVGAQQYLIASALEDECASRDSTVYRFDGVNPTDLDRIDCVEADDVTRTEIVGGYHVGDFLYLGDRFSRVFLMRIEAAVDGVDLSYVSKPMTAYMIKDKGLAVDEAAGIAVEANTTGMHVWDISDPGNPVRRSTTPGDFNRAAVSCQFAWAARKGFENSERTFDISDPLNPQPFDDTFWSPERSWNYPSSDCAEVQGAIFSPDQSILYLARYGLLQMVDMAPCGECNTPQPIFSDSFEVGTTERWSGTTP